MVSQDGLVIQATRVYLALAVTQVYQAGAVLQVTLATQVPLAGLVILALGYQAGLVIAATLPQPKAQ